MGDGLKLSRDKRHRSSSSIAGVAVEGTRSERKLEIRGSIPEVDDQFALAEARCDDLQEKIDLVKVVKRKKKLKKRSMTRVNETPVPAENIPFITVRTQPKKKAIQARLRRLETPPNPVRGYVDPVTVEQHRMLGQMRGYDQPYPQELEAQVMTNSQNPTRPLARRARADGDTMYGRGVQISTNHPLLDMGTGATDADFSDNDAFDERPDDFFAMHSKKPADIGHNVTRQMSSPTCRRRHVQREATIKEAGTKCTDDRKCQENWRLTATAEHRRRQQKHTQNNAATSPLRAELDERPVVELFNKSRGSTSPPPTLLNDRKNKKIRETRRSNDQTTGPLGDMSADSPKKNKDVRNPRKIKYRSRRYELPTVASQMKQAGVRYYYGNANHTNIPFIVSKSTAPSHNIGVNIQQVLNGLKIQQPLSGIPSTIAHHMGLFHINTNGTKSATVQSAADNKEINVIKMGRRQVRLPSYKYISYNRMLSLYREGDGMVPRFLRSISRPHYFYTSMYNLATHREDLDGATSKGNVGGSQAAKQSLAEYASLYREYEQIDKSLKEGTYEPEWERRRDELARELAAREDHIRRVVHDYRSPDAEQAPLRATASNAEDGYRRQSSYRLSPTNPQ
ncbi:uncharacterized protein isoform X3 [Choristoneura fumiferana]|uniref:uncharacterized protein isoform X3 n=1 Tax=Choristoneura fumiferana TaxID=7141 RepID=UPI003D154B17